MSSVVLRNEIPVTSTTPKTKQKVSHSHGQRKVGKRISLDKRTPPITPGTTTNTPPVLTKPKKFTTQASFGPVLTKPEKIKSQTSTEEHNRYYRLSFGSDQELYVYKQVLGCVVIPQGTQDLEPKTVTTNKELIEKLRQAFGIDKDTQDTLVQETSVKKASGQEDVVESEQSTVEEFHYVVKAMYRYAVKVAAENPKFNEGGKPKFQKLPNQLNEVINQFATHNHFSKVTQSLVEAVVVMEICSDKYCPCVISEKLIKDTLVSLEMDWQNVQFDAQSPVLSNVEMAMFDHAATTYTVFLISSMKVQGCVPRLFPADEINMEQLNKRVSMTVTLLNMNVWDNSEHARKEANNLAVEQIQDEVKNWCIEQLISLETMEDGLDNVTTQANVMASIVQDATKLLAIKPAISQYFQRLSVDYYKVVSLEIEKRLSSKIMELMQEVDQYQVHYHKQHKHVLESSSITLKLYFALRNLFSIIRYHVGDRELFKTLISSYKSWFGHAVMFWLQTFRAECIKRMEKALEIEKDVVQVTSLVKYSNSSVDVVSCFSKVTHEWKEINFGDADIAVLGCTKIVDTVCDGATQYVERLHTILENNGYYDFIDNAQFDVTDQLCITLNNVMHVRKYLHELQGLLNFEQVCHSMSVKYEDETIGNNSAEVLDNLIQSADYDMMVRCRLMIQNIVQRMGVDIIKFTKKFTQKEPEKKSSIDALFGYLDDNLKVLYEKMEAMIFPMILEQIWNTIVRIFSNTVLKGKPPEYYHHLIHHLYSVRSYVRMDSDTIDDSEVYHDLLQYLQMHSMTTQQLALMYYKDLQNVHSKSASSHDTGTLTVKLAYREETEDTITVIGQVYKASSLPGVTEDNSLDPLVTIMLHPHTIVNETLKPKHTSVQQNTKDPIFVDDSFTFEKLDINILGLEGSVVIFTIWHHETVLPDDFIGEVVLPLGQIKCLGDSDIDQLPDITMPVLSANKPKNGPLVVLQERQKKDKEAKKITSVRMLMAGWEYSTKIFSPFYKAISKAKGKKVQIT